LEKCGILLVVVGDRVWDWSFYKYGNGSEQVKDERSSGLRYALSVEYAVSSLFSSLLASVLGSLEKGVVLLL